MKDMCVPFFDNGNLAKWTGYVLNQREEAECYANGFFQSNVGDWRDSFIWKPNAQFRTILFYDGYGRGRSSIKFGFKDSDDKKFYMFATDLDSLIKQGIPINKIDGIFEFIKRGQNYGIRFVSR